VIEAVLGVAELIHGVDDLIRETRQVISADSELPNEGGKLLRGLAQVRRCLFRRAVVMIGTEILTGCRPHRSARLAIVL